MTTTLEALADIEATNPFLGNRLGVPGTPMIIAVDTYGRIYDVQAEPVAKLGAKTGMSQAVHIDDAFSYSQPIEPMYDAIRAVNRRTLDPAHHDLHLPQGSTLS